MGSKVYLNINITKLLEEDDIGNATQTGMAEYIKDSTPSNMMDVSLPDYIDTARRKSIVGRLESSYKWSIERYRYKYRNRTDMIVLGDVSDQKIKHYLTNEENLDADSIVYYDTYDIHPYYGAFIDLVEDRNYTIETNTFTGVAGVPTGVNTYLKDVEIQYSYHDVNKIILVNHSDKRRLDSNSDPTEYFDLPLNDIPELLEQRIVHKAGATDERVQDLTRPITLYSIPGFNMDTANVWQTSTITSTTQIEPVPNPLNPGGTIMAPVTRYTVVNYVPPGGIEETRAKYTQTFSVVTEYLVTEVTRTEISTQNQTTTTSNAQNAIKGDRNTVGSQWAVDNTITATPVVTVTNTTDGVYDTETTSTSTMVTEVYVRSFTEPLGAYVTSGKGFTDTALISHLEAEVPTIPPLEDVKEYISILYLDSQNVRHLRYIALADPANAQTVTALSPQKITNFFYATMPFRRGKQDARDLAVSDPDYKAFRKLGRKIGLPYKDLRDKLYKSMESNLHIVENVYLTFGVPTDAPDIESRKFLFGFFNDICDRFHDPNTIGIETFDGAYIPLYDGYIDKIFQYKSITRKTIVGNLGVEYASSMTEVDASIYGNVWRGGRNGGYEWGVVTRITNYLRAYRRDNGNNSYTVIVVTNPEYTMAVDNQGETRTITEGAEDAWKGEKNYAPFVPIDRASKRRLNFRERELVYSRNACIVFTSKKVVKVKWYQTVWFQLVLIVVTFVLTVVTFGTAAVGLAAFNAFLGAAIVIVGQTDSSLGKILKIIQIIYAIYSFGVGFTNGLATGFSRGDWLTFIGRVGQVYMAIEKAQLNSNNKKFQQKKERLEKQYKERIKQEKALAPKGVKIDLRTTRDSIEQGFIHLGDTVDSMIARTISVQTGLIPISHPTSYVQQALALPTSEQIMQSIVAKKIEDSQGFLVEE